jgi:hypothetical protein
MRIHRVDTDFIRELREATSQDLTVDQLVALAIHGVDASVFAELLNLGVLDSIPAAKAGKEQVDEQEG